MGTLWTSGGIALSTVTYTAESGPAGSPRPATPVPVTANTTYVASYHAPVGFYAANQDGFASTGSRGPLNALRNGTDGANGVYAYGASGFPTNTYHSATTGSTSCSTRPRPTPLRRR